MPTYTDRCKKCGRVQEILHPITRNPRIKCAVCGGPCLRQLGTGVAIIFKGSGFYETDYKNKGSKAKTDGETHAPASSEAKAKTETAGTKAKSGSSTTGEGT